MPLQKKDQKIESQKLQKTITVTLGGMYIKCVFYGMCIRCLAQNFTNFLSLGTALWDLKPQKEVPTRNKKQCLIYCTLGVRGDIRKGRDRERVR